MDYLSLVGRNLPLFQEDLEHFRDELKEIVSDSRFLVIGGAGTIGQAVAREIFKRNPLKMHVVDISENNLVEFVRDVRSTVGYIDGDFKTFAIDCGTPTFESFYSVEGPYDYVLNLSAMKHVRSEKDPFTLMRMIEVNVLNTVRTIQIAKKSGIKKYFCASTDKAATPVNMMGASKRIMELYLMRESLSQEISTARFANVAFSDGSLLHGFNQRIAKRQPLAAPRDVQRFFVTPQESGELCLISCLLGHNRDIFFPKLQERLHSITFSEIAIRYLDRLGFEAVECSSEEEARANVSTLIPQKKWPCYFNISDTTGEKEVEEFFTDAEDLDLDRFRTIGVIRNTPSFEDKALEEFEAGVHQLQEKGRWSKQSILDLFFKILPDFAHKETGKNLDQRM